MKEALFYDKLKNKQVQCKLCPHNCFIGDNKRGYCGVRENQRGKLYSLVYGKPIAIQIDPIEKKPMYHFMPGEKALSFGTVGCTMSCEWCQNYNISKAKPEDSEVAEILPDEIINMCIEKGCKIIAFTYSEPVVFYEYMIDIAKLARKNKIKNVLVSNGYINEKPLKELCKYIDGANIDLKSFNEKIYKRFCNGNLKDILKSLKLLKKNKVWLEITNLVIPEINDNKEEVEKMCKWISTNLGKDVPLHFSKFFPMYKMSDVEETPIATLEAMRKIAEDYLEFVYLGNVNEESNTKCPSCGEVVIKRSGFFVNNELKEGKCKCEEKIPGVWD